MMFRYHLVELRVLPLLGGGLSMAIVLSLLAWFYNKTIFMLGFSIIRVSVLLFSWWRDVTRESLYQGHHRLRVTVGIKKGFILFIVSEVLFFFSFFWRFFEFSLSPTIELGGIWPPRGLTPLAVLGVPLLNTILLLRRGVLLTLSHGFIISRCIKESVARTIGCIILGLIFTLMQGLEYMRASFRIRDRSFGTSFFVITGFHGLHVLLGTGFLMVIFLRLAKRHFSLTHHTGFEAAAWYWHFVDVVWIFLFFFVYAWAI